jgi:hypothetical protein
LILEKARCTHISVACKPNFGTPVDDAKNSRNDALNICRRFLAFVWNKGGRELAKVEDEENMNKVFVFDL